MKKPDRILIGFVLALGLITAIAATFKTLTIDSTGWVKNPEAVTFAHLKASVQMYSNAIAEYNADAGVTIDGLVLIKDGALSGVTSITASEDVTAVTFHGSGAALTGMTSYSVGEWTPVIYGATTAGTGTYTRQTGHYAKIGKLCFISCSVVITAHDGTGNMRISGLPFTAKNASGHNGGLAFSAIANMTTPANTYLLLGVAPNATNVFFVSMPVAGGSNSYLALDTAFEISFAGCYMTE